jgi:hypothetical protein
MKCEHTGYTTVEWVNGIRCPLCEAAELARQQHGALHEAERIFKRVLAGEDAVLDLLYTRSIKEEIERWLEKHTGWKGSQHENPSSATK